ncbi:helix-turn-helix domain-containing protein [Paenibacillus sp. LMG 31460]|uniref:Helix-turn-helix domain-containing protein n=1 Tax=Paenibacillus germinis TaxID=2654979 RepID=A0ABX1ZAJ0_9BACL|nr:helix-turn-helix domain-containing protein [Paenibacillus germinis]NOU89271.1 helix-turn-helix domain-containing protein [Paenibacillus germinis]
MSFKKFEARKGAFYRKNLILVLLINCLLVSFIGISLYYAGGGRIVAEVNKSHQVQLNQSIQRIHDYFSQLEQYSAQVAFNPGFNASISTLDFNYQFERTKELLESLSMMRQANPLISSVFLYLKDQNSLIGDYAGVRRITSEDDRRIFLSLLEPQPGIYLRDKIKRIDDPDSENKAVVIKLPGWASQEQTYGAFIIYINQVKLNELVEKLTSQGGAAFLVDQNGEYITTPAAVHAKTGTGLVEALRERVLKEGLDKNTSVMKWNGQSYSVSYGKMSFIGSNLTYISATPLSSITAPVNAMSKLIVIISFLGLIASLLLSWFASKRIYNPIGRLMRLIEGDKEAEEKEKKDEFVYLENQWKQNLLQNVTLSTRLKELLPRLREGFLIQFLQGHHYYYSESEIIEKMRQFDWDILDQRFAFIMVQMHGISSSDGKFSEKDEQLVSFAASKIMQDLASSHYALNHVIDFQDLSVAMFVVLDDEQADEEALMKELRALSEQILQAVKDMLGMRATILISSITDAILQTPDMLEQTRKELLFRDIPSTNQVLVMSDFKTEESYTAQYPFELEREITGAVRMGLEDEAMRLISEFVRQLQQNSRKKLVLHQAMLKLLGSILDAIMRNDTNPFTLYKDVHLYEQLMQIRETHKMLEWFRTTLIHPYVSTLSLTNDPELKQSIDKMVIRLQQEFMDEISLEAYADEMQLSPYKLSKSFKQLMGTNFIDYVTKLRLDKCKELLLTSNLKINDIADMLNYQSSYLIRIFKKSEGMTPGQYRDKHSQAG